jgi:RHS repeat-associated protein
LLRLSLTGKPAVEFKWNGFNKLTELSTPTKKSTYGYGAYGGILESQSVEGGAFIFYVRDVFGRVLGEYRKSGTTFEIAKVYTHGADGLISQRDSAAGASYWYLFGAQEETRALVTGAGVVVNRYDYDAYGAAVTKVEGVGNDFEYTGKHGCMTEDVSGLVLCGQRWYAPWLRRWVSRDPIRYDGGYNVYEYVGGRVTTRIDPSGLQPLPLLPPDLYFPPSPVTPCPLTL